MSGGNIERGGCLAAAGCCEGLCLSCRPALVRLPVLRRRTDADGVPLPETAETDIEPITLTGTVCGLLTKPAPVRTQSAPACTADSDGAQQRSLTVAASTLGRLHTGDRVGIGGRLWRVTAVEGGKTFTARLLPEWEEEDAWD